MPNPTTSFSELRDDWYRGAELMARLIDQSSQGATKLVGFPAQWNALFELMGADWADPSHPGDFIPLISDLETDGLMSAVERARREGRLRLLVEALAALDPLVADVLHRLDRRSTRALPPVEERIQFTGWQSYGRPEVLDFEARVLAGASSSSPIAVLLPCARRRPYDGSKTHRRLEKGLGTSLASADRIVISSLGVIPSTFWSDPVVLAYDSGVPDIYRVLRLMRAFFGKAHYEAVVDCLEFEPYRDCLQIIRREGLIGEIRAGPDRRVKKLPRP
jgi:predicted RNA-binding protein